MGRVRFRKTFTNDTDDLFGWQPILSTMQTAIDGLETPGCIALYGSWGAGKTHTLRLLKHKLNEAPERYVTVWFDPWEYEQTQDLVTPLMAAIHRRLADRIGKGERYARYATAFAKALAGLSFGTLAALAGIRLESKAWEKLLELEPKQLLEAFTNPESRATVDNIQKVKDGFRDLVKAGLDSSDKRALEDDATEPRLVIFLDDLDRCLPNTVENLVEAVKLLLCGDSEARAIFVFGLDRAIVGVAIAKRYTGSSYSGESYLEKIFDVSMEVPRADFAALTEGRSAVVIFGLLGIPDALQPHLAAALMCPSIANPRIILRTASRVALLFSGMSVERFGGRPDDLKKLCSWVAGTDRYRSFRTTFFELTEPELRGLHQGAFPQTHQAPGVMTSDGVKRLLGAPGFLGYYRALFPPVQGTDAVSFDEICAERKRAEEDGYQEALKKLGEGRALTLADIDNRLRSAGL